MKLRNATVALALCAAVAVAVIPKLEVVSAERPDRSSPAIVFHLRIANSNQFPVEELPPQAKLPPNPCRMSNAPQRLWLEIFRIDGTRASCSPVMRRTLESFVFHDYNGDRPRIYVVLTDLKSGATWRSRPLDTSAD
jgi:hypothetical protein